MNNDARYQSQSPMCHVCDARMRGGLPPLRECERCGGDGTATKVYSCQRCKEREGWTTVAEQAVRTINGYLGIKPDSPPEVTIQTLRELIDMSDEHARRLGELQRKRPMTEAEGKLVEAVLLEREKHRRGSSNLPGPILEATVPVLAERFAEAAEKSRPITPEELAVVEAAKVVARRIDEENRAGVYGSIKDDSKALCEAVRRLK